MQAGYVNSWSLAKALTAIYDAKRAAEFAPGVGVATDVHILLADGAGELWPNVKTSLESLYEDYQQRHDALILEGIEKFQKAINGAEPQPINPPTQGEASEPRGAAIPKRDSGAEGPCAGKSADDPADSGKGPKG
jgi:hypothetical protein